MTAYTRQTWIDGLIGATPVSAARLNHMEDGIADPASSLTPNTFVQVSAPNYLATADLQSALNTAAQTGSTLYVGSSTLDNATTGITVPDGVTLICRGTITFPANFSGVGVLFDGQRARGDHVIRIKRAAPTWDAVSSPDTTSIGVRFRNCTSCKALIQSSTFFWTGLDVQGDGVPPAASQDNVFVIGDISDNKINLTVTSINGGYSNNHTFIGGQLRHSSGFLSYVGTREIYLPESDGNTFVGIDLEAEAVERTVDINAPFNTFLNCRWELSTGIWLGAGANGTQFFGGYNLKEVPIHDSSGGKYAMYAEGIISSGNNSAAQGWSIGYANLNMPYVQCDPTTNQYQFNTHDDHLAPVRLGSFVTGDPGFVNGPGVLKIGSPVTAASTLDTTRYLEVLVNGAIVKLAIIT